MRAGAILKALVSGAQNSSWLTPLLPSGVDRRGRDFYKNLKCLTLTVELLRK